MVPVAYNYRNLFVRWKTTFMTASGFTLVVAALVVMLAFVNGIEQVCVTSGEPENILVTSKGNADEVVSRLPTQIVSDICSTRGVAQNARGRPLASRELFMVVNHHNEATGDFRFLQIRGVLAEAFEVHTAIRVRHGRQFRPGQSEVIIGAALARDGHLAIGDKMKLGRKEWRIAGVFSADGSAFESEVWCDLTEVASQFKREGVLSTVVLRAPSGPAATRLAQQLSDSKTVAVSAQTEVAYYEKQAEQMRSIQGAAWTIAWFMGIGAIFGVMNTMFAAIGQRTKDIAVMRILGFKPFEILISFLIEALLISSVGGCLGAGLGYLMNGVSQSAGIGGREVQFAFVVDGPILGFAAAFTLAMGVAGGLLPALSVVRIKPLEALR